MLQLPISNSAIDLNRLLSLDVFSSLGVAVSPAAVWTIALLIGIMFFIISSVMSYHWRRFGFEKPVMARAALIYFSVSGILLGGMIISLAMYSGIR